MSSDNNKSPHPWLIKYPPGIDWHADIQERPVYEILEETTQKFGNRPAFDHMDKKWTWGQIGSLVNKMAKGLQDLGVKKGTRVGICLPNLTP